MNDLKKEIMEKIEINLYILMKLFIPLAVAVFGVILFLALLLLPMLVIGLIETIPPIK